jgi:hypothetical protein
MFTGVEVQICLSCGGNIEGESKMGIYGWALPFRVTNFSGPVWLRTNEIPSKVRVTVFETDQPAGYHVEPDIGKFYRVLWTRIFEVDL